MIEAATMNMYLLANNVFTDSLMEIFSLASFSSLISGTMKNWIKVIIIPGTANILIMILHPYGWLSYFAISAGLIIPTAVDAAAASTPPIDSTFARTSSENDLFTLTVCDTVTKV